MVSLGQHLDDRQRRGSVIHPASVVANRGDGDVDVAIRQTGKTVRASRGNTGGSYTPGQLVQVSRTDASGVTSNTGWVIIGPAPSSMRGSSKSSPLTETTRRSSAVVTRIDPNPVELLAGGGVAAATINGVFPEGTVVLYGGVEFAIYDDTDPVITADSIELAIAADYDLAIAGDFDITVGASTLPAAIRARRPAPTITGSVPSHMIIYRGAVDVSRSIFDDSGGPLLSGSDLVGRPALSAADTRITGATLGDGARSGGVTAAVNFAADVSLPLGIADYDFSLTDPVSGAEATFRLSLDIRDAPAFTIPTPTSINAIAGGPSVSDVIVGTGFVDRLLDGANAVPATLHVDSETQISITVSVPPGTAPGTYNIFCVPHYIGGTARLCAQVHVT